MPYIDIVKIYSGFLDSRGTENDIFCMRARKVLEAIVENLIIKNGIILDRNSSLFDKIDFIEKRRIIDQASVSNYHYIRKQTNPNIHVGDSTITEKDKLQIEKCIVEEIEKYKKYILKESKDIQYVPNIQNKKDQKPTNGSGWAKLVFFIAIVALFAIFVPSVINIVEEKEAEKEQIFFQEAVANYVPSALNQITIIIGERVRPGAAVWCQGSNSATYTSDESIVTINSAGVVTGISEGRACVVIKAGGMHKSYGIKVLKDYEGIGIMEQFANKH